MLVVTSLRSAGDTQENFTSKVECGQAGQTSAWDAELWMDEKFYAIAGKLWSRDARTRLFGE